MEDKTTFDQDAGSTQTRRTEDGGTVKVYFAPGAKERLKGVDIDAMLRDVAGIGPEADEDEARGDVWAAFDRMSKAEQRAAVRHKFSMKNDGGAGWEYPRITLDGEEFRYRVSYIGPSVGRLIGAIKSLKDGGKGSLTWMDEPGAYTWNFSRRGNLIYVEIPGADDGVYMKYDYLCKQLDKC